MEVTKANFDEAVEYFEKLLPDVFHNHHPLLMT